MSFSKPKKQAAPPKPVAPVKKEDEDVRTAQEDELRRGMKSPGRQSANLLQSSNYGSSQKNLLG
jgi:hypothetical protein